MMNYLEEYDETDPTVLLEIKGSHLVDFLLENTDWEVRGRSGRSL